MNEKYIEKRTKIDEMGGWWSQYKNNSIGRGINYLYHIAGLNHAENSIWGTKNGISKVWKNASSETDENLLATVDWSKGYPDFTFLGAYEHFNKIQNELLNQKEEMYNLPHTD